MKRVLMVGVLVLVLLCFLWLASSRAAVVKVGGNAPDFALPDQNGKTIKLSDYLGKKNVVLAFYIKAFTGG